MTSDCLNSHKLAIANLTHQAKNKLDLVRCIELYGAAILTHPNSEVRKIPLLLSEGLLKSEYDSTSVKLSDLTQQSKESLQSIVDELTARDNKELSKLVKQDYNKPCLMTTSPKEIKILAGTKVVFPNKTVEFTLDTKVKIDRLKRGSNYQVVVNSEGKALALNEQDLIFDSKDQILIGGFHYAPGSNATDARTGGAKEAQINPYSIWDLAWRPSATDPRGMTLVDGEFWCDIYPMTEDGKNTYGQKVRTNIDWWETNEQIANQGKRCPSEQQFQRLAFGTTENQSSGVRIDKASLVEKFTSKWGVMMSTGCYYVWGNPFVIPEPKDKINS